MNVEKTANEVVVEKDAVSERDTIELIFTDLELDPQVMGLARRS